jgi:hypothetical protein
MAAPGARGAFSWPGFGVGAPKNTPAEVVDKLNKLSAIKRSRRVSPTSVARCWWAPPQPAACLI